MREVEALLFLETFVIVTVGGSTLETITSGCEVVGDDTLLNDVGDIVHVIDRDVTLVLGIDPIELFQRVYDNGVSRSILACETTVCILDEDGALDVFLENGLIDGFWF